MQKIRRLQKIGGDTYQIHYNEQKAERPIRRVRERRNIPLPEVRECAGSSQVLAVMLQAQVMGGGRLDQYAV